MFKLLILMAVAFRRKIQNKTSSYFGWVKGPFEKIFGPRLNLDLAAFEGSYEAQNLKALYVQRKRNKLIVIGALIQLTVYLYDAWGIGPFGMIFNILLYTWMIYRANHPLSARYIALWCGFEIFVALIQNGDGLWPVHVFRWTLINHILIFLGTRELRMNLSYPYNQFPLKGPRGKIPSYKNQIKSRPY